MVDGIVCFVEKSDTTRELARQYILKGNLEDLELMANESVANAEKLDTILELAPSYFQTELRKILAVATESVHNVGRRATIRGLVR
jgi:hypothetical protein